MKDKPTCPHCGKEIRLKEVLKFIENNPALKLWVTGDVDTYCIEKGKEIKEESLEEFKKNCGIERMY